MSIPNWYELTLLALAAFRTWRLLAEDDITERARRYVTRLPRDWQKGNLIPQNYRERLAEFIECSWCLGFWVALAWWGAFQVYEFGTLVVAVPLAISALVPFFEKVSSQS